MSRERLSGIELFKVIGIICIVLNHTIQTLSSSYSWFQGSYPAMNFHNATTDPVMLVFAFLSYSGALGNTVFFIGSAWFLTDSKKADMTKWMKIILDAWVISVIILAIISGIREGAVEKEYIVKSLFPSISGSNWYVTCYLLFYPLHPILNQVIRGMDERTLRISVIVSSVIYLGIAFLDSELLYYSQLICWIVIYFLVAYIKLYHRQILDDRRKNILFLAGAVLGHSALIVLTNILGLHSAFFSDKLLHWVKNNNPFIICAVICLFNLFRQLNFTNRIINYISSLSLLVYLIHENVMVRVYVRPLFFAYVYSRFGFENILFWTMIIALAIFMISLLLSALYGKTLGAITKKVSVWCGKTVGR